jgi:hypothetical protein
MIVVSFRAGWFGQVVEQKATSLHLQWIDGQSDWLDDIVQRSEYRVVESPQTEAIVGESLRLSCCVLSTGVDLGLLRRACAGTRHHTS